MAERIYPSAKPNAPQPPPPNAAAPAFPATKGQTYGRPMYRPQPPSKQRRRRRSGRSCCCSCCLWLTLILVAAMFLAAIAGGAFYVLYRPHRPSFSVSYLRLAQLNLTSPAGLLTSRLDLSLAARNPNKKIDFLYDPISVSVSSAAGPGGGDGGGGELPLGEGSFPSFLHEAKNTTVLKTTVTSSGQSVESSAAADLRKRSTIPLRIELDTRAGMKVGKLRTKRIGIRVSCQGLAVSVPKKKGGAGAAATPDVSCKVKLRIKIWKWTF